MSTVGCNLATTRASASDSNPDYDFLSSACRRMTRGLPDGGGYLVTGLTDVKPSASTRATLNAISLTNDRYRYWHGIDTNVTVRAQGGLRLQGGTSTGREVEDHCDVLVDSPENRTVGDNVNCHSVAPFQTNFRGTASYVDPEDRRAGQQRVPVPSRTGARRQLRRHLHGGSRLPVRLGAGSTPGRGETVFLSSGTTKQVNLLPNNTVYGESHSQIDLKVGKIIRFGQCPREHRRGHLQPAEHRRDHDLQPDLLAERGRRQPVAAAD